MQNDQDDCDHNQGVKKIPTHSSKRGWSKHPKQPQDDQNDDDSPSHELFSYLMFHKIIPQPQGWGISTLVRAE